MRSATRFAISLFVAISAFCTVLYTSCKKKEMNPCDNINCLNGGACNAGKCVCPTGFEGVYCQTAVVYVDPCKNVVCLNGGTCSGGTCSCPDGYEGTTCEVLSNGKFIKTWTAADTSAPPSSFTAAYTVAITAGTAVTQVVITNFSDGFFSHQVNAVISGNAITIPLQEPDNDDYFVQGSGSYSPSGHYITWNYTLKNPSGDSLVHTGVWQ